VRSRAGLDDVEKRKFLTLPGLELRPLGRPLAIPTELQVCCANLSLQHLSESDSIRLACPQSNGIKLFALCGELFKKRILFVKLLVVSDLNPLQGLQ
jgi:hypothetical protein